jgi:hypothetical protein
MKENFEKGLSVVKNFSSKFKFKEFDLSNYSNKQLIIRGAIFLIILIVIVVIFVFVFKSDVSHVMLIDDPEFLTDDYSKVFSFSKIVKSKIGIKYTYIFWLYNDSVSSNSNWNNGYDIPKGIFTHYNAPNVQYIPSKNILQISIGYKGSNDDIKKYVFEIENLKLQVWQQIACVVNNRYCMIYLNGELYKATYLPNVPWRANRMLIVGDPNNNFNGYLARLEYFNNSLNGDYILNNYNRISGSLSNNLKSYAQYFYKKIHERKRPKNKNKNFLDKVF